MQYMILIYGNEREFMGIPEAEQHKVYGEYMEYSKQIALAGIMKGGASLKDVATATTVRVKNGKTTTTDGPFAETKEQLGGYYVIDVPTLDEAVAWGAKCPGAKHGSIEIRPLGIISADDGGVAAMQ